MVTTDRNVEHQQNAASLPLTVYVLFPATDKLADWQRLTVALLAAMDPQPSSPTFVHVRS